MSNPYLTYVFCTLHPLSFHSGSTPGDMVFDWYKVAKQARKRPQNVFKDTKIRNIRKQSIEKGVVRPG